MTITIFVIALVVCATTMFYVAFSSRRRHARIRPVDLKALRNLMDRDEENFLRERLSRGNFFQLKRQRIQVTLRYVKRIAGNTAVVLREGQSARLHPDPEVTQAAALAIELATQIRM